MEGHDVIESFMFHDKLFVCVGAKVRCPFQRKDVGKFEKGLDRGRY